MAVAHGRKGKKNSSTYTGIDRRLLSARRALQEAKEQKTFCEIKVKEAETTRNTNRDTYQPEIDRPNTAAHDAHSEAMNIEQMLMRQTEDGPEVEELLARRADCLREAHQHQEHSSRLQVQLDACDKQVAYLNDKLGKQQRHIAHLEAKYKKVRQERDDMIVSSLGLPGSLSAEAQVVDKNDKIKVCIDGVCAVREASGKITLNPQFKEQIDYRLRHSGHEPLFAD